MSILCFEHYSQLFGTWSLTRLLRPDLYDASSPTEHTHVRDQHLRSFDDIFSGCKGPEIWIIG